jgi:DNA replication protein DnaC
LKRLAEFNVDAVPTIPAATLGHLAAGHYMDAGEPVVLLGDSGTGKSHLLIGLGLAACEQGRRVRYATTAQLVNELVEAADERVLSRVVARYGRLDLLLLDELLSQESVAKRCEAALTVSVLSSSLLRQCGQRLGERLSAAARP